ncbi:MAG: hypothetical protein HZC36_13950 [Armatimonadetes bacterium]|nr:hypothetical protein [Armatimonadota bacterium]
MKFRLFGCGKFQWLSSESEDRELSEHEVSFLERHKRVCRDCAKKEDQRVMALNMLRNAAFSVDVPTRFNERVLRRHRVESVRAGLTYWSPALVGGAIAFVAMLAALQLIASPSNLPTFRSVGAESHRARLEAPAIPNLDRSDLNRANAE